jgi:hypothetical protein
MIKSSISAICQKGLSTVYCIVYDDFLYIGITEDFSFNRWSSHFSLQGSFVKAIRVFIPEYDYKIQEVLIISVTFVPGFVKNSKELKALEKMLHINFDCNPFVNKKGYTVISNTTCTAPRKFNYEQLGDKTIKVRCELEKLL